MLHCGQDTINPCNNDLARISWEVGSSAYCVYLHAEDQSSMLRGKMDIEERTSDITYMHYQYRECVSTASCLAVATGNV